MADSTYENPHRQYRPGSKVRKILFRVLMLVLVLAVLLLIVFFWLVRSLPNIALVQIAHLTNTRISASSVKSNLDGSVLIEGLVIRPTRSQSYDDAILKAKKVFARFDVAGLLLLRPRLHELNVKDFVLDAQFDLDSGRWNFGDFRLNIPAQGSDKLPAVSLEGGIMRYSKVSAGKVEVAVAAPVDAQFAWDEQTHQGYSFNLRTAKLSSGLGQSNLKGYWKPGKIILTGGFSSTDIPSLERAWAIDVLAGELSYGKDRSYKLKLSMKNLHSTRIAETDSFLLARPAFLGQSNPFTALQDFFGRYRPSGTTSIYLESAGNLDRLGESKVNGTVTCHDLSICDVRFPYRIEHLTGEVDFTENGFTLKELSGRHNNVDMTIRGWSEGFGEGRKYQYRLTSNNMVLSDDLYSALTEGYKGLWSDFSPQGIVAIDYRLSRSSPTDKQETLVVKLLDVRSVYRNFPYPLEKLTGSMFFDRDSILADDLVSQKGRTKIALGIKVTARTTKRPLYYVSIKGSNIPLDRTLAAALRPQHKKLYEQIDPNGLADIEARVFTPDGNSVGTSLLANVSIKQASIKLGKAPLIISDISAQTVITQQSLDVRSFTGGYQQGTVSLTGTMQLTGQTELPQYYWRIGAKGVPLDGKLIGLLPEAMSKMVSGFRPEGKVDVVADLNKSVGNTSPDYNIVVDCLSDSINPERFAYPLKDITGRLTLAQNSVVFENISAAAATDTGTADVKPAIKLNGTVGLKDGSFADADLKVSATDLSLNDQLGAMLPERFRQNYLALSPTGRLDLDLKSIKISNTDGGEKLFDFSGEIRFKNFGFSAAGIKAELDGSAEARGAYKTGGNLTGCSVIFSGDTLTVKNKAVTDLQAALVYDPSLKKWSADNFTADCYGGRLLGNLKIDESDKKTPEYLLEFVLNHTDLRQFLLAGRSKEAAEKGCTSGIMNAALSLSSRTEDGASRFGACKISIADMQIGKVSPLSKLLAVLRLTEPTDYTFERMLIDSYISRDKLVIKQFDMSGRSVAFNGSGWMDLPKENINLTLTARGQRLAATEPSILQSLTEGLGGAVVRMEVTGNAYDPQVETKALPVIEDSLKILGTPK
jgi:hypothetical protein